MDNNTNTRVTGFFMSTIFILFGAFMTLLSFGFFKSFQPQIDPPQWSMLFSGAAFLFFGLTVLHSNIRNIKFDAQGKEQPRTPLRDQIIHRVLIIGILASMTFISGWVVFDPGERHFKTSVSFLNIIKSNQANDISGRVFFGICFIIMTIILISAIFQTAKKIREG